MLSFRKSVHISEVGVASSTSGSDTLTESARSFSLMENQSEYMMAESGNSSESNATPKIKIESATECSDLSS